jgi:putative ABC transport system permease protein
VKIPLKYNLRNLFVRRTTTLMTIVSLAFVVLVYVGMLAMASGLRSTFANGDPRNVMVLRQGARSETESFFEQETGSRIAVLPGVARGGGGEALAAAQLFVVQLLTRNDGTEGNVSLRGVEPAIFAIRPGLKIVAGRRFVPGQGEVIVGHMAARRFRGLGLGRQVTLGRLPFRVVGVFAGEESFASEIWGAVPDFADAFRRYGLSSMLLQAATPAGARRLVERIRAESLPVEPALETEYFARQARTSALQFVILGNVLAVLMAFGACFAAANTMYAQVSARSREIGTLRSLGFRRRTILSLFLIEAGALGLLAGIVGAALALPLNGLTVGTNNAVTFSEVGFRLRTTPDVLFAGILLATLTGLAGGLPAAVSAARRPVAELLRDR